MPTELHSIVVPFYNEEAVAEEFFRRTTAALDELSSFEIVAVDDGSTDGTWEILRAIGSADARVRAVRFARNFGHQTAITAGIDLARGDTVTVIDADLQDPPELIPRLVAEWRAGADVVFAVRESRDGDSAFKRSSASAFYRMLRKLAGVDIPLDAGDFRLMSRRAAEGLRAMRERSRYVRGLVAWMGMKRAVVTYDRDARHSGTTKYPLRKMVRFAVDGVVSFSTVPLQMAVWLGAIAAVLGFIVGVFAIGVRLTGGYVEPGWTSLIVSILFLGGMQLMMLGVLGEYLGRVYDEVRGRPLYLVSEVQGFDEPVQAHFRTSPLPIRSGGS